MSDRAYTVSVIVAAVLLALFGLPIVLDFIFEPKG